MNAQQTRLLQGLNDLLQYEELTDVILMAEEAEFPCHRNILAASSPYFRAMFTAYVRESTQRIIPIHGISKKALGLAIKFIYTGLVDITNDNVQVLITASNIFQLETLLDTCVDYMAKELCVENCLDVYDFAEFQCLPQLKQEAKLFIMEHFVELFQNEHNLKKVDKKTFTEFISSDDVEVEKEEIIYKTVLKWINADANSRATSFPSLFSHIRLTLMSRDFIQSEVETNPLVANHTICRTMISVANIYNLAKANNANVEDDNTFDINTKPRRGMFKKKMLVFSGGVNAKGQRYLSCFDPETSKNYVGIKPIGPFDSPYKVNHYRLAVTQESNIFFIGGELINTDSCFALDSIYHYLPKQRTWQQGQSMHCARCCFAVAVVGSRIYVFGGLKSHKEMKTLNDVEVYETENNEWHILAPMPVGIFSQAACAYQEDIFIFGGRHHIDGETQYLDTVLKYSLTTDTWALVATEMINPRAECCAFLLRDKIFVLGGRSKYQNMVSVDIYDPVKNKWKFGQDFPEDRSTMAITLFDDVFYVCGGRVVLPVHSRSARSRSVERKDLFKYDPERDEWSKVVKLIPDASFETCTAAKVDTQFLEETDFVSSL